MDLCIVELSNVCSYTVLILCQRKRDFQLQMHKCAALSVRTDGKWKQVVQL